MLSAPDGTPLQSQSGVFLPLWPWRRHLHRQQWHPFSLLESRCPLTGLCHVCFWHPTLPGRLKAVENTTHLPAMETHTPSLQSSSNNEHHQFPNTTSFLCKHHPLPCAQFLQSSYTPVSFQRLVSDAIFLCSKGRFSKAVIKSNYSPLPLKRCLPYICVCKGLLLTLPFFICRDTEVLGGFFGMD